MQDTGTIRSILVRCCQVPIEPPVETASGSVPVAPLVLIDVVTSAGVTGRSYLFTYTPVALKAVQELIGSMAPLLEGQPVAPVQIQSMLLKRFRLLGTEGLVQMALSGLDMALWDALSKTAGLPLAGFLGAEIGPVRAYASLRGLASAAVIGEAERLMSLGITTFKLRFGAGDPTTDLATLSALRKALGAEIGLMVDYNQTLTVAEAKRRLPAIDELGLIWIEEPTLAGDFPSQAEIRQGLKTPVQAGENWWGPQDAARSIAAHATDLAMPDLMKIGGVTGWQHCAALAISAGLPVSSHLFPEVSAHMLRATANADWLEYLDLAGPILTDPLRIKGGKAIIGARPGNGLEWNERAVARFSV
jgi:mandelate racemase